MASDAHPVVFNRNAADAQCGCDAQVEKPLFDSWFRGQGVSEADFNDMMDKIIAPINEGQIDYKDVLGAFDAGIVTKRVKDADALSWKIDCSQPCLKGKGGRTVWYDDAETLAPKFRLAGEHGLRGVGMWKVDDLPAPAKDGGLPMPPSGDVEPDLDS